MVAMDVPFCRMTQFEVWITYAQISFADTTRKYSSRQVTSSVCTITGKHENTVAFRGCFRQPKNTSAPRGIVVDGSHWTRTRFLQSQMG